MNSKSLARTIPGEKAVMRTRLKGYQRRVNVPYGNYLYMNLAPRASMGVGGVLIPVTPKELEDLKKREYMYECVDVSGQITDTVEGVVYAFIAPDVSFPGLKVPRSYLLTCLGGIDEGEHESWLAETIIENDIEEDALAPVYENTPEE